MNDNSTNKIIGVLAILLVTFIILKLCGEINWSWWIVAAPLWIPILFLVGLIIYFGVKEDKNKPTGF